MSQQVSQSDGHSCGNKMTDELEGMESLVTMEQIQKARQRLQNNEMVVRTPVLREVQAMFPEVGNLRLHLKMENMQTTGSFKIRGVVNQLEQMIEENRETNKTLVTMSAGNYGQSFAYYLQKAAVPGICVMPLTAPDNRVALIKSMGVKVQQCTTSDLQPTVDRLVAEQDCVYCHSFDDPASLLPMECSNMRSMPLCVDRAHKEVSEHVEDLLNILKLKSTLCSLEVLEDGVEPDVVLVCCGGGGLVSGIATAFKLASKKPVRVYAVEPEGSNTMFESMRAGHAVTKRPSSVASGLSPPFAGKLCYAHCRQYVEDVLLVSDQEIVQSMGMLFARGIKAEPSGCAAMAAVLNQKVPDVEGKDVLVVITGGNVSLEELKLMLPGPS